MSLAGGTGKTPAKGIGVDRAGPPPLRTTLRRLPAAKRARRSRSPESIRRVLFALLQNNLDGFNLSPELLLDGGQLTLQLAEAMETVS